jgi:hypothetical protein
MRSAEIGSAHDRPVRLGMTAELSRRLWVTSVQEAWFSFFHCDQAIVQSEDAQKLANSGNGFKTSNPDGASSRKKGNLVDGSIGTQNPPSRLLQELTSLKEKLDAIVGLVWKPAGMTELCINFVKPHEIEIVRSRKVKQAARAYDAMKLPEALKGRGQMLNGFARDKNVEEVVREGECMGVTLDKASG